jgi:hypothetical protein
MASASASESTLSLVSEEHKAEYKYAIHMR